MLRLQLLRTCCGLRVILDGLLGTELTVSQGDGRKWVLGHFRRPALCGRQSLLLWKSWAFAYIPSKRCLQAPFLLVLFPKGAQFEIVLGVSKRKSETSPLWR